MLWRAETCIAPGETKGTMNFLLYMAGRSTRRREILRGADRREALIRGAAKEAAAGRLERALEIYRRLADEGNLVDRLIRGQLELALGRGEEARENFAGALEELLEETIDGRLNSTEGNGYAGALGGVLVEGERLLRDGLYARALEILRRGRSRLEVIVAAEGAMAVAGEMADGSVDLAGLTGAVMVGDCLLRLMARVQLSRHVSGVLRERKLREDLAPWATRGRNVTELLEKEFGRLTKATEEWPGHAETQFRRGLVARVIGRTGEAAGAFEAALKVHPHHVPSAARCVVTRAALGEVNLGRLRGALMVGAKTIELFGGLAGMAREPGCVEKAAARFCGGLGEKEGAAVRGNLALALGEVGAEGAWAGWRETAGAGER